MESKIRIKIGSVEVEYEGSESFLKNEIPKLIQNLSELQKKVVPSSEENNDKNESSKTTCTTSTIAGKIGCSSGPQLALAAAIRLILGLNKKSFTRKELLAEMKESHSYYRKSYGSHLQRTLGTLVKDGKLNEISKNNYSLSEKEKLEAKKL